ncbi:MAG: M3 family metallopeptidase [Gemmatimonadales bacterium]|nr:M3 family metallopeptidase [Gemmatimonadales bacterium]
MQDQSRMPVVRILAAMAVVSAVLVTGCERFTAMQENPLLAEWDTPFGVPPFDKIEDDHYLPAFRAAMDTHAGEIQAIVDNAEDPTFANTIEALDRSGKALTNVSNVFFAVEGANSNDALREVARTVAPELAAHRDDITLNPALYARVKAVYDAREGLGLTPEQLKLLEETHKGFVRAGVSLPDSAQVRLREINAELAELSQSFGQNLLKETNAFELHVTDAADLGDLPVSLVAAAAEEAERRGHESGWSFTLQRPSINPFLQYSPNREMRRQLFVGYAMRGDNGNAEDNKAILSHTAALRAERAELMGYPTHAHYELSDVMAETPERVYDLLDQIWAPALRVAKDERAAMAAMMLADGVDEKFEGWDWRYYAEKVRQARYDFDENALRPYFEVTAVRDAAFMIANKLFGLTFTRLEDVPMWHPDQQVFEVHEADGKHLGILYMDFFARESKNGGAWMNDLRAQSRLDGDVTPIVTTNFNFPPPTDDGPSLLAYYEAETLLHEFGHALHGLLSNVTYASLSGTNVPSDFVEFPSQVMENWLGEPEVLSMFAKHYQTGEVVPAELIEKLNASSTFDQGFTTVEYLAASYLDMAWHMLTAPEEKEPRSFEQAEMRRIGLIDEIIPRYRSPYFAHIFSGGYSAGYYSYIWAEVLDADAFQAFKETSLFDQATARSLRDNVLSRGGTRPGMESYIAFRGRAPSITPLLKARGLTTEN